MDEEGLLHLNAERFVAAETHFEYTNHGALSQIERTRRVDVVKGGFHV
jgi:hypothetical protein